MLWYDYENIRVGDTIMEEKIKESVYTCYHCGNTGLLKHIGTTCWKNEDIVRDPYGEICDYTLIEHTNWHVYECPVCNQPVVISEYVFDVANEDPGISIEFPKAPIHNEGVPKGIASAFESAVKTKGIDSAICLLSLRRVLEMICKEKGATGGTLEDKITCLIASKVLPDMLDDACWIIRKLGNEAAHPIKPIFHLMKLNK